MRATVLHASGDVRVENVPDPSVCLAEEKFWSLRDFSLETIPLTVIEN